jgi:hypothetical protein
MARYRFGIKSSRYDYRLKMLTKVGSLMVEGFLATGGVGLAVLSMMLMEQRSLKVQAETSAWTPVPSLAEMGVLHGIRSSGERRRRDGSIIKG